MVIKDDLSAQQFRERIESFQGKSAAIVYGFSKANEFSKVWYDQWRSSVISSYGHALEEIGINPYFVDAQSFAKQALDGSIPDVICAFNLNAGITPIHHWSMVPAVASWCGITPLPSQADVLIVGERKDTASLIARECGFRVPETIDVKKLDDLDSDTDLIVKPRDLGGSVGVRRASASSLLEKLDVLHPTDIIQTFIHGYDLTIPVVWQPTLGRHRCVAGVLYLAEHEGEWIHSAESKRSGEGYSKRVVSIPPELQAVIAHFAEKMELGPYARVDLRIALHCIHRNIIALDKAETYFIEVNPLPTLRSGINFLNVVGSSEFQCALYTEIFELTKLLGRSPSEHAIVLACAIATLDS